MAIATKPELAEQVRQFVMEGFRSHFDQLANTFPTNQTWVKMRELGTELWLDTGSIEESAPLWTREFTALTTNNTLLNKEVQKGQYDDLIIRAAGMIRDFGLDDERMKLELAFILNARHGLRLVERFDAHVSVEEHTDLADDVDLAIDFAHRFYEICPQRFIVKLPFTPAGLLATRQLSRQGIPVNHTLGFSARQNYAATRIARPEFVNVFLGRLSSFVADNKLGDGLLVGERATLASQMSIAQLRLDEDAPTRQIGASFRSGQQVKNLMGIDVMTMPPKAAEEFLSMVRPEDVKDASSDIYQPKLAAEAKSAGIESLWRIEERLADAIDALEQRDLDAMHPDELVSFFNDHKCGDFMVGWTDAQRDRSYKEGKIPRLENWREELAGGRVALDSLMNLAGLSSFKADQQAMDDRVRDVLSRKG